MSIEKVIIGWLDHYFSGNWTQSLIYLAEGKTCYQNSYIENQQLLNTEDCLGIIFRINLTQIGAVLSVTT